MPQRYTIIFPGDVEHRFSDKTPSIGTVIAAHGKSWIVIDEQQDRRVVVRELAAGASNDGDRSVGDAFGVEPSPA